MSDDRTAGERGGTSAPEGELQPSEASRLLGGASLLASLSPLAACLCVYTVFTVPEASGPRAAAVLSAGALALAAVPAAGLALAVAGVRRKGRPSRLAWAGLVLNALWVGLVLFVVAASLVGGRGRYWPGGGVSPTGTPW
jgi:hypothetical protein